MYLNGLKSDAKTAVYSNNKQLELKLLTLSLWGLKLKIFFKNFYQKILNFKVRLRCATSILWRLVRGFESMFRIEVADKDEGIYEYFEIWSSGWFKGFTHHKKMLSIKCALLSFQTDYYAEHEDASYFIGIIKQWYSWCHTSNGDDQR